VSGKGYSVCPEPGCPSLVPKGSGRCREHRKRVSGWESGRLSRSVLRRQGGVCAACGRVPEHPELDHRIPLDRGGTNDRSNLQVLCDRPCHLEKTRQDRAG
jgi:5-methylcytosine-specific restriction endonuclease McrA